MQWGLGRKGVSWERCLGRGTWQRLLLGCTGQLGILAEGAVP